MASPPRRSRKWRPTGSNDIIGEIIVEADREIYERLTSLVNEQSIYSFLLVAGYLKVLKTTLSFNGDFMCEVALPNKEISLVYRKEILQKLNDIIPQPVAISITASCWGCAPCSDAELRQLSEIALQQIIDKKYDTELTAAGVQAIYQYGVAFSGKRVAVAVWCREVQE